MSMNCLKILEWDFPVQDNGKSNRMMLSEVLTDLELNCRGSLIIREQVL